MHNSTPLPKKGLIAKFHEEKLDARVNVLLSAAHMLHSVGYQLFDEADDILKASGMRMGQTKQLQIDLRRAYNAYLRDFAELIERADAGKTGDARMCRHNYFADLDKYTPLFRSIAEELLAISPEEIEKLTPTKIMNPKQLKEENV